MAENTSLLQSIPPVGETSSGGGAPTPAPGTDQGTPQSSALGKQNTANTTGATTASVSASTAVPSDSPTITVFQYTVYGSFVLNFVLAGFAAVVLFKKFTKLADARFSASVRWLAIGSVVVVLHGFFVTYLYASYLNDPKRVAPLVMTYGVWVLLGPIVGYVARNLLARTQKPNVNAALIDSSVYALIFGLSAFSLSPAASTNVALIVIILTGFLVVVPIARSLSALKLACARHPELKKSASSVLLSGLLYLPALLPVFALAHVFGTSDLLTIFFINCTGIAFTLVVSISALKASSHFDVEASGTSSATRASTVATTTAAAKTAGSTTASAAASTATAKHHTAPNYRPVKKSTPGSNPKPNQPIVGGNLDDPIIQFLNSEAEGADAEKPPNKPKPAQAPRIPPPKKPAHPGLTPPKKPASGRKKPAPNAPEKLKAPPKPRRPS